MTSEQRKLTVLTTFLCEVCDNWYIAGGSWDDEIYCRICYHERYPCPEWCNCERRNIEDE